MPNEPTIEVTPLIDSDDWTDILTNALTTAVALVPWWLWVLGGVVVILQVAHRVQSRRRE